MNGDDGSLIGVVIHGELDGGVACVNVGPLVGFIDLGVDGVLPSTNIGNSEGVHDLGVLNVLGFQTIKTGIDDNRR